MKFIEFDKNKCDECYKCLRTCPTKALAFAGDKREIIDELCIKCGLCQASCPQGALQIQNDKFKILKAINANKKVVVSLAPSFVSAFEFEAPEQIVTALMELGFKWIEETAVGAEVISNYYEDEINKGEKQNIITSCCPSTTYLIEKYYPEEIKSMIPVISPMILHGRMLKEKFGEDCFVVFIGPCLAKKDEAEEVKGAIDAVLTFNELVEWFEERKIKLPELPSTPFDSISTKRGCAFPLGGSLWKEDFKSRINNKYKYVRVEGIDNCTDMLKSLKKGNMENFCIEMNICNGSCINGPDLPKDNLHYYERESRIYKYVSKKKKQSELTEQECEDILNIDVSRTFKDKSVHYIKPTEEEITKIMASMGKYSEHDQLNCGACGYTSCLDKAEAVFAGNSDSHMCLPYMRSKAESMQAVIFENTPNIICILDEDLRIKEYNPAFDRMFNDKNINLKNFPIYAIMDDELFKQVKLTGNNIIGKKEAMESLNKMFYVNIIKLEHEKVIVCILTDITLAEKNREELLRVKERTVTACQGVIDKQMRVAQEIASLLGETTAETKVSLNKLKDVVLHDDGGL